MNRTVRTTVLPLVAAHAAVLLTLAPAARHLAWPAWIVVLALVACQVGVLAVWAALGDDPWFVRYPLLAFAIAALAMCLPVAVGGDGNRLVSRWALVLGIEALFAVSPLLLLRGIGARIVRPEPSRASASGTRQFSIRYLIVGTAAVALLLGLTRLASWQPRWDSWSWITPDDFRMGSVLGIGFAGAALLGAWTALSGRSPAARAAPLLLLSPAIGIGIARLLVEQSLDAIGFAISTAMSAALVAGTMVILRQCGYAVRYVDPQRRV